MKRQIRFETLTADDIEMVRQWRNDKKVNAHLFHRDYIDEEQQISWFNSIDWKTNQYFIAKYKSEPIGLFYITNINLSTKTCEPNGFIGIERYRNTFVSGMVLILFFQHIFSNYKITALIGRIMVSNANFLKINEQLGAQIDKVEGDDSYRSVYLSNSVFMKSLQEEFKAILE